MSTRKHDRMYVNLGAIERKLRECSGTDVMIVQAGGVTRRGTNYYAIFSGNREVGTLDIKTTFSPEEMGESDMQVDVRLAVTKKFGYHDRIRRGGAKATLNVPCTPGNGSAYTKVQYSKAWFAGRNELLSRSLDKKTIFTPQALGLTEPA